MDWQLAIEKNRAALKRILAMLVAMVAANDGSAGGVSSAGGQFTFFPQVGAPSQNPALAEKSKLSPTLPRHLHRLVLRLLRPAEAATRRLIIIAARGLVVELAPPRLRAAKPKPVLNRSNGFGTGVVIRPGPLPEWAQCAGPEALVHRLASAVRPAQTVRRPPQVSETKRHAAHQLARRPPIQPALRPAAPA